MTQLNTPYPATAYLTGFLRQHEARLGLEVSQADAALELFLRVFSRAGLQRVLDVLQARAAGLGDGGDGDDDDRDDDDDDGDRDSSEFAGDDGGDDGLAGDDGGDDDDDL